MHSSPWSRRSSFSYRSFFSFGEPLPFSFFAMLVPSLYEEPSLAPMPHTPLLDFGLMRSGSENCRFRRGWGDPGALGQPDQLRHRFDLHLFHDAGAMDLDGFFGGSDVDGGLLVEAAADHMRQNLVFARGEGCQTPADLRHLLIRLARHAVLRQCGTNGLQQLVFLNWFGQKIGGALLHGAHGRGDVGASTQEDNGQ